MAISITEEGSSGEIKIANGYWNFDLAVGFYLGLPMLVALYQLKRARSQPAQNDDAFTMVKDLENP